MTSLSGSERFALIMQGLDDDLLKSNWILATPGTESLRADHNPATLPEKSPLVKMQNNSLKFRFVFRQGVRRITLQRYLVTKMILFPGTINLMEVLVFFENLLWCNAKRLSDPQFAAKFGSTLEVITKVCKQNRIGNRVAGIRRLCKKLAETVPKDFLYPERNLPQIQEKLKNAVYSIQGESGRLNSSFPPRTFIGKGYRDHGCLRDQAWDGSPSWQEVASCHLDVLEQSNET